MRILHVLTYYYPHWTGLTKYAQRLAEGHAARGHQVSVLTSRHDPALRARERVGGVDVYRLRTAARVSRGVVMPSFAGAARALIQRHDVVVVHIPMLETVLVTGLARRLGRPSVVVNHGDLIMPEGGFNQFVQGSLRWLMRRGLAQATVVTTHSQDYANHSDFMRPFLDKVMAIYPPIVIPPADPAAVAALRARLGVGDAPVIGFAGRFVEEKGFDYLLRAVPLIAEQLPEVRLAFAGERNVVYEDFSSQWAHLFDSQHGRIASLGLLTDECELATFYAMCDAFAIPSRTDCFPSVQVEVMMSGSPVVASDIPGARVAVQVTGAGLLVPPGDPPALAAGLVQVLREPARYTRPLAEIEAVLGIERSLDEYERLFAKLIESAPRRPDA